MAHVPDLMRQWLRHGYLLMIAAPDCESYLWSENTGVGGSDDQVDRYGYADGTGLGYGDKYYEGNGFGDGQLPGLRDGDGDGDGHGYNNHNHYDTGYRIAWRQSDGAP